MLIETMRKHQLAVLGDDDIDSPPLRRSVRGCRRVDMRVVGWQAGILVAATAIDRCLPLATVVTNSIGVIFSSRAESPAAKATASSVSGVADSSSAPSPRASATCEKPTSNECCHQATLHS